MGPSIDQSKTSILFFTILLALYSMLFYGNVNGKALLTENRTRLHQEILAMEANNRDSSNYYYSSTTDKTFHNDYLILGCVAILITGAFASMAFATTNLVHKRIGPVPTSLVDITGGRKERSLGLAKDSLEKLNIGCGKSEEDSEAKADSNKIYAD